MRITDYKCFTLGTGWRNLTYLMIETDEGICGFGEAHIVGKTHTVREYLKDVRRHIIGHEVYNIEELYNKFTLLDFGAPGQVTMTGLALVEMACWDCIGKRAGLPVYKLIGGAVREKIPAYANGWYTVERTPQAFHEAAERVVARGYKGLKFDPFGNGDMELSREEYRRAMELVEAVSSAAGADVQIFIEMHGRFSISQAIEICKELEKYNPGFVEEPCRPLDVGALEYVMRHTTVPIAAGERLYLASAYNEVFRRRAVRIVQPDISQCGGLLEVKKICSTAEPLSIMAAPHNVGGIIATMANVHLMATLRNGKILEHFNDFSDSYVKNVGAPYPEVTDGYFHLPDGPGWGVEVDLDFLKEHEAEMVDGVIQDPGLNMYRSTSWNLRSKKADI
ncbi:MAG: mandelate racemase/muconate lactonizing enzyme family protein [Dorea sp.]|nr:mandelate racemase/muconate lactonizing enzyme family protein [Dorea sp.]